MGALGSRTFWGLVLVAAGVLLLVESVGILPGAALLWPVLVGTASVVFLYVFFRGRKDWWAAIPGFSLLGLVTAIVWGGLTSGVLDLGGALFLGGAGLGFVAVYIADHARWWALIPGGALLTLALVSSLPASLAGTTTGGILFLGFALTFGLLAVINAPEGRMRWPLLPAVCLALIGTLITAGATGILNYVWPVALILGGVYLVLLALGTGGDSGHHA